jgi:hypothetical protein
MREPQQRVTDRGAQVGSGVRMGVGGPRHGPLLVAYGCSLHGASRAQRPSHTV